MCGATISELRAGVATYAGSFDASLLTAADAVVVVDEAARIEKMAAPTLKALAAARAAETDLLERQGDASPAHALARRTGSSVAKASEALRTGRRLGSQPALAAAARRGGDAGSYNWGCRLWRDSTYASTHALVLRHWPSAPF